jgi:hypothetical protein
MPFEKVGKNKNKSSSGKLYTDKQKALYYATKGFQEKAKKKKKSK